MQSFIQAAVSMLKQEYKEDETSLKDAIELGVKVFGKTLDTNKLTSEKGKYSSLLCFLSKVSIIPESSIYE